MKKPYTTLLLVLVFNLVFLPGGYLQAQQKIKDPKTHYGFEPGTNKMLFNYESLISYLQELEKSSDQVKLEQIGTSPMGKPMYTVFISSAENIKNLGKLKEINKQLAINSEIPDQTREEYIREGKVFFLFTLSMHSNEVAPSQALPLIVYDLLTTQDANKKAWLNDVVYMVVPNHNPDGMNMIVDHYNKYKETKYDGASMPGVYHKYVGHDNNRDFVALTQSDTRAISQLYSKEWFPQVMVEKHQMGSYGPRYFVSPPHDPIAENIDAGIWNWMKIFGSRTITKMTQEGLTGVSQNYLFDDYWPGATETCIWKNMIGMLTEAASVKYATPIYIEPNELRAGGKGMGEYKKSINMPAPWPGGWWTLNDLMQYEITSTMAYLETAALYKKEILQFRNDMCRKEVEKGKTQAPYYYVFPIKQHDQSELANLVNLLNDHGVKAFALSQDVIYNTTLFNKGDIIVPLAQPFRAFIKEMLESQVFPERHYTPDGELIQPYDITSWSLPLHKGVKVFEINTYKNLFDGNYSEISYPLSFFEKTDAGYKSVLLTANHNNSYLLVFNALQKGLKVERILEDYHYEGEVYPAGSFIIKNTQDLKELLKDISFKPLYVTEDIQVRKQEIKMPRIALLESYFHPMDAGWTRYLFDTYHISFETIHPDEVEKIDFIKNFDVVVIPDEDKTVLIDGTYKSGSEQYFMNYPPEYLKGMGKKGFEKILKFIDNGGKVIAWRDAAQLFYGVQEYTIDEKNKEVFEFPVRDISGEMVKKGFECPGSLLKIQLKTGHPITYGMESEIGVFHRSQPVFATRQPNFDVDRRVLGTFPEKDILLSGFTKNEELIGNKSTIVWLKKGKGQVVLFSFNPQFRASTPVSYKLLFNSLLL
ncbi:MAG TPA: M14 family metallopeptidase [Bacteroidales bacterium]|nr:M14 family metallopeptidase [Bacteroidales bacterium]